MNSSDRIRRFTEVRAFGVATLTFAAAACVARVPSSPSAPAFANAPAEVANRAALPHCGIEHATHNSGFNVDGRACFWNAYVSRRPAEFITTQPTIEGDPVTWVYRIEADGRIVVYIDTTYDLAPPNPPPRWIRLACPGLSLSGNSPADGFVVGLPDQDCEEAVLS